MIVKIGGSMKKDKRVRMKRGVRIVLVAFILLSVFNLTIILLMKQPQSEWMLIGGMVFLFFAGLGLFLYVIQSEREYRQEHEAVLMLEDKLLETEKERDWLQQANHAKALFLERMAKEIKAPVESIMGTDQLIFGEKNPEMIAEYADTIKGAGDRLLDIIADVLDLTLIEEGRLELEHKEYSTRDLLEGVISQSRKLALDNKLEYELLIDESVPSKLVGDAQRIAQSLRYILSNAIKYTPIGKIHFCMGWEWSLVGQKDEVDLLFTVADTGVGIKEEELQELFESFQLLSENSFTRMEGTGLGLTITTNLLSLMGSSLDIESEYGQGTIFAFRLTQQVADLNAMGTLEPEEDVMQDREVETKGFLAPNVKLLVVDDNDINLAVVKGLLGPTKMQVDTANSGKECIQMAMATPYDIILMDYLMPEMNGIETLDYLRMFEENQSKDAAIIILTADLSEEDREMFLNHGFTDYLTKPVESQILEKVLMKHIPDEMLIKADTHEESIAKQVISIRQDIQEREENALEGLAIQEQLEKELGIYIQEGLRLLDGNVDQYRSVLRMFTEDAPDKYGKLSYAIAQDDCAEYEILAHSLKSSAKMVGAVELGKNAQELEDFCNLGQWDQVKKRHTRFGKKLKDTMNGFKLLENVPIIYDDTPAFLSNEDVWDKVSEIEKHLLNFELDYARLKLDKLLRINTSEEAHKILQKAQKQMKAENYDGLVEQLWKIFYLTERG